jgi:hypothetical protein
VSQESGIGQYSQKSLVETGCSDQWIEQNRSSTDTENNRSQNLGTFLNSVEVSSSDRQMESSTVRRVRGQEWDTVSQGTAWGHTVLGIPNRPNRLNR